MRQFKKCSYFRCENKQNTKSMFHFPPVNDLARLEIWVRNCGNMTITHLPPEKLRHKFVCIDHFNINDVIFQPNRNRHTLLNKNAVPYPYKEEESQPEISQDPILETGGYSHFMDSDDLGISYTLTDRKDKCSCKILKQHKIDVNSKRKLETDIEKDKIKQNYMVLIEHGINTGQKRKKPKKVPENEQDGCTCRVQERNKIDIDCELMKTKKHNINIFTENMNMIIPSDFGCIKEYEDDECGKESLLRAALLGHMPKENELEEEQLEEDNLEEDRLEEYKLEKDKLEEDKLEGDKLEGDKLEEETLIFVSPAALTEEDPLKDVDQNDNSLLVNRYKEQTADKVPESLFLYDEPSTEEQFIQDSGEEIATTVSDIIDMPWDQFPEVPVNANNIKVYSYLQIKEEPQDSMDTETSQDLSKNISNNILKDTVKEELQHNTEDGKDNVIEDLQCATEVIKEELPCKTEYIEE